ncbi:hypothetical protein D3C87_1220110 [compost metagenome]
MKYNRVVVNKNEIISEATYGAYYPMLTGKYAFNAVFTGEANYTIEKRNVTLVPGSFIFLNHDTCYSNRIDSPVPFQYGLILNLWRTLNMPVYRTKGLYWIARKFLNKSSPAL